MKATLKHVANQYILIVDERPKVGDWYYMPSIFNGVIEQRSLINDNNYKRTFKIIAAENLDGVKGIALIVDNTIITDIELINDFFNEYRFIDTEVEVTENEDYWVVRL